MRRDLCWTSPLEVDRGQVFVMETNELATNLTHFPVTPYPAAQKYKTSKQAKKGMTLKLNCDATYQRRGLSKGGGANLSF